MHDIRYTHNLLEVHGLLVGSDEGALNEELVLAFCGERGFFFHGLKHHYTRVNISPLVSG
jgi:predicted transcriptional regulator